MQNALLAMILVPLVGSIINGLLIRGGSAKRTGGIATLASGLSFLAALSLFFRYNNDHVPIRTSFEWFSAGNFTLNWGFTFDALTAVMALVVTGIGTLIHLYSIGYMAHDKSPWRYFAYLNLFLFNMLVLISGDSLPVMFVGWEGVGLCSYLLIGFWFEDPEKAKAGMKAFVVNRIGDAGFLMGIFLCYALFETVEFEKMSSALLKISTTDLRWFNLAGLFLFIGAMGKSAQIPLYVWLPDAMAGPTPVSALIHAATMVTAGIYLVARMGFLFQITQDTNQFIAVIGLATALIAALIATSQRDIKKVLAYSTVSQLGLMVLALGCKAYFAAIFHLMTHAFFKALLFLGAGSVIHALDGEQDISHMGGLRKSLPRTFITFAIATAAICGIPPLSGFFSKDTILFDTLASSSGGVTFWALGLLVSTLTAFYMTRLLTLVFFGEYRGHHHPHESPAVMTVPLMILAVGSVFAGFVGMPHGLHLLPNFLEHFLEPAIPVLPLGEAAVPELIAMAVATGLAISAMFFAFSLYKKPARAEAQGPFRALGALFENKFYIDELYEILFIRPFEKISLFFSRFFDKQVIDGLVHLPGITARGGAALLSLFQIGSVQFYLLVMLMGALVVFWLNVRMGVL
jgi:NADH-quinone oxidoreductase subunit L